jgi:hypothetical protein
MRTVLILPALMLLTTLVLAQPAQLSDLRVNTRYASVQLNQLFSGGPPPNGIPPLGFSADTFGFPDTKSAQFETVSSARTWLADREPVILVRVGAEAGIFPLQVLVWHEIANTTLGGVPVAVTFCPLCNTAIAFDRRVPLNAEMLARVRQDRPNLDVKQPLTVTFGVSGLLYLSDLVMFDSATHTLWSQAIGQAIVGTLTDTTLNTIPAQIVSFERAAGSAPNARVLSARTGYLRDYGRNPYVGYDKVDEPPFLFNGVVDGRLAPKERVVTVSLGSDVAYPWSLLQARKVLNDTVAGTPIAVFWQSGTSSALDDASIADARDVGATGVFARRLANRVLTFEAAGNDFRDRETSSTWAITGEAIAGPLRGNRLEAITHGNHFWFAWAAFKPQTRIYK